MFWLSGLASAVWRSIWTATRFWRTLTSMWGCRPASENVCGARGGLWRGQWRGNVWPVCRIVSGSDRGRRGQRGGHRHDHDRVEAAGLCLAARGDPSFGRAVGRRAATVFARRLKRGRVQTGLADRQVTGVPVRLTCPRGRCTRGRPVQAALRAASRRAMVSPMADGLGATVMPAAARISTFSCADSPKALMIAPAWPILRPFGADRPAI